MTGTSPPAADHVRNANTASSAKTIGTHSPTFRKVATAQNAYAVSSARTIAQMVTAGAVGTPMSPRSMDAVRSPRR